MLIKNQKKDYAIKIRLSRHELWKLEAYATKHNKTVSSVIRDYIGKLPNIKDEEVYGWMFKYNHL